MAISISIPARNAMLDALETYGGLAAKLEIRDGSVPASANAPRTGTVGVSMDLPSSWMADAASGQKALSGTWEDPLANASIAPATYFTIFRSDGTTVVMQGTVSATGGGGDLQLTTTTIVLNQPVTITAFTLTAGNP